jgi:hypothetical protein
VDWFRITLTVTEHGVDPNNGELLLEALVAVAPHAGGVVSQNTETGALSATIAVEAPGIAEAAERAIPIFAKALGRAGLTPTDVLDIAASLLPADEYDSERDLQLV